MTTIDWRRLPALSTLRAFEATVRCGGYSAAARSLNVTTAAIAQHVRKLEAELGLGLVHRQGRGLAFTEAGQDLAQALGDAFAGIAESIEAVRARQEARGVRVSTTVRFVDAVIMPGLGSFWSSYPGVQVSFSPDVNTLEVDLDRFDLVVRGGGVDEQWGSASSIPLLRTHFIVCGAPGLVARQPPDLGDLPWIMDASIGDQVFNGVVSALGLDPARLKLVDPGGAKFELDAALSGYGLHVTPELTVRRHLQSGQLVSMADLRDWEAVYYVIHRAGRLPEPVVQFRDWLVDLCATL